MKALNRLIPHGLGRRFAVLCAALISAEMTVARAVTISVTSTADLGSGSLRDAMRLAQDGDIIDATGVSGIITLLSGELLITNSVNIIGPGPGLLAIDGHASNRVFEITQNLNVTISGLTISNGVATVYPAPGYEGGGVFNSHTTLTISNCVLTGNSAYFGGGLFNDQSVVTLTRSAITGNSTSEGGGGIFNDRSTLFVDTSLICSNSGMFNGGGLYNNSFDMGSSSLVVAVNMTLCANSAGGGGIVAGASGGGIFNSGFYGQARLQIFNSTICDNTTDGDGDNISGERNTGSLEIGSTILRAPLPGQNIAGVGTVVSRGYNLSTDGSGPNDGVTDLLNTDPLLGPLQDNGGPTPTYQPLACSPAIDQGKNFNNVTTDQRGGTFVRTFDNPDISNPPGGDGTDIGAFEAQTSRVNNAPVVKCKDVTVSAGLNCTASASIDDGSTDPDDDDTVTLTQTPPGPYALGKTIVTLTAIDRCGASNNCTATVTVVDDTPPTITCPTTMYIDATSSTGAVVNYSAPNVSDACSAIASATSTPAPGSLFAMGDTAVTTIAVDAAGNTNTCTFTIHINSAAEQVNNLAGEIVDIFDRRTERSLLNPLNSAWRLASRRHPNTACRPLTTFIKNVGRNHTKGQISDNEADQYIQAATRIRAVLNCH